MSDITDSEILSIAYDLNAMPEQMTDKALYRFARAMILIGSQAQQERIAALEAQIKTPATITLPNAEDCAGKSFVITNNGDRSINVELAKELPPTRAQLLAVAEAARRLCAVSDHPVLLHIREALRAAGYLGEGE